MKIAAITPDQKHDYLASTIIEGLTLLGHEVAATATGNGIAEALDDDDFVSYAKSADLILAVWGKVRNNTPPKFHLLDSISRKNRTAYIDGSEWTATGYPEPDQLERAKSNPKFRKGQHWIDHKMLDRVNWYFKRECYPDDIKIGIIPFPFGVMKRHQLEPKTRERQVLCCFGQTINGLRKEIHEHCLMLSKTRDDILVCSNVSHEKYVELLRTSRIVLDAWGGGDCNARFWEAVGCGACVMYQRYNIIIPHPYVDNVHAVGFSTLKEFQDSLNFLLNNQAYVDEISRASRRHTQEFHTTEARAKYLLKLMELE